MPVTSEVLDRVVKAYDIRGLVEGGLDAALCEALGSAAGVVLGEGEGGFVVGRDMRPTSEPLARAFVRGLTSVGLDVVDIGLASTDMLYFASGDLGLPGAMFTASHNPAEYNGIKLCRAGAAPVSSDSGLGEVRRLVERGGVGPTSGPTGNVRAEDVLSRFATHVRGFVDVDRLTPVRLAVDAGNGMAGHVVPAVFEGLPFDVEPLYFELDGSFPNHPANPLEPENMVDLQAAVRAGGHALGLAFDGDADRVFAVDEQGRVVPSSLVAAVVADRLLAREPGATILHNLICSDVVRETIEAAGGTAVRTRVGHSYIKARMAETGALYACEHSGHFYFRDNYRADSGLIAALVLLEAVAEEGRPLSEVVAPYDRYVASGERNHRVDDADAVLDDIESALAPQATGTDRMDGLTVRLDDGWANVRASNTEPYLRVNAEGRDEAAMRRILALVEDVVAARGTHRA